MDENEFVNRKLLEYIVEGLTDAAFKAGSNPSTATPFAEGAAPTPDDILEAIKTTYRAIKPLPKYNYFVNICTLREALKKLREAHITAKRVRGRSIYVLYMGGNLVGELYVDLKSMVPVGKFFGIPKPDPWKPTLKWE